MQTFIAIAIIWASVSLILWIRFVWPEPRWNADNFLVSALVAAPWPFWGALLLYDFLRAPKDKISGAD